MPFAISYVKIIQFVLLFTIIGGSSAQSIQKYNKDNVMCDCIEAERCKGWLTAVGSGKYLDIPVCGFNRSSLHPLLCCPRIDDDWNKRHRRRSREIHNLQGLNNIQLSCKITSTKPTSPVQIAKQKCGEYGKLVFQSLFEVSVDGEPLKKEESDTCVKGSDREGAKSREFPHMALIGYQEKENVTWDCAGSLISERFILGVAHCTSNPHRPGGPKWAKLGELDLSTDTDIARPQIYKITDFIVHPDYNKPKRYHDIALFKLEKDIEFTIYVRPVCLYTRRDPPDSVADATGWGRASFAGDPSNYLKKVKMELVSYKDCVKFYNSSSDRRQMPDGISSDTMICSKELEAGGPSICQGDSGGPLQVPLKTPYCMYALIGLTSFGKGCGFQIPGVSTRVSYYVPWIVENVWPDED